MARKVLLTSIILIGLMFSCLDTSIVSTALVNISIDLGNDFLNAPWAILAYLLSYMSLAVGFCKASDVFGRRNMCLVAWLFFSGASIACGLAQTMPQLIAFRALQGVGGSGLYSLAQICLIELGPGGPELIGALVGVTLAISYVMGPILGGLFSSYWTWRAIFWIKHRLISSSVPFGVFAILGLLFYWEGPQPVRLSLPKIFAKIDILGISLLSVGSLLLVFGIQEGGSRVWDWSHPVIVGTLVASGLSWSALCAWQFFIYKSRNPITEPIFPVNLVTRRVYPATVVVTLLSGFVYISLVIQIPEQLQIIHRDSPVLAGVHLLPMLGACAFGSFATGAISKRKNYTSHILVAGAAIQMIGSGLIYAYSRGEADIRNLFGFTTIYGLGVGLCFAAATIITTVEARHDDLAAAQGVVSQARVFGGAFGLAICTIVFNAQTEHDLAGDLRISPEELDAIHRSPMALLLLKDSQVQTIVRSAYLIAFERQMLVMVTVGMLAIAASICTWRPDPPLVVDMMAQHKEFPARGSITELELMETDRTLHRDEGPN
ncbi:MFS general substrate transporter [Thozetella sp. PMI_491]|nr:MFS general substrate transporter [Thozetella sp. PMI_491]